MRRRRRRPCRSGARRRSGGPGGSRTGDGPSRCRPATRGSCARTCDGTRGSGSSSPSWMSRTSVVMPMMRAHSWTSFVRRMASGPTGLAEVTDVAVGGGDELHLVAGRGPQRCDARGLEFGVVGVRPEGDDAKLTRRGRLGRGDRDAERQDSTGREGGGVRRDMRRILSGSRVPGNGKGGAPVDRRARPNASRDPAKAATIGRRPYRSIR